MSTVTFQPYGLDPADPKFEKYLAAHWGLDYNNGEPDVARALAWYHDQKRRLEQAHAAEARNRQPETAPVLKKKRSRRSA
jgi:hypothetical protein